MFLGLGKKELRLENAHLKVSNAVFVFPTNGFCDHWHSVIKQTFIISPADSNN